MSSTLDTIDAELGIMNAPENCQGIGNICDACNKSIQVGETVLVDACKPPMKDRWEIDRVFCSDHAYDEEFVQFEGTPNYDEVRAHAVYHDSRPTGEPHPHVRDISVQYHSAP